MVKENKTYTEFIIIFTDQNIYFFKKSAVINYKGNFTGFSFMI